MVLGEQGQGVLWLAEAIVHESIAILIGAWSPGPDVEILDAPNGGACTTSVIAFCEVCWLVRSKVIV